MRRHKIHSSWRIAVVCAGIVVGAWLAFALGLSQSGIWLVLAICFLIVSLRGNLIVVLVSLFCGGLLIGLFRGSQRVSLISKYEKLYGMSVILEGEITDDLTYDIDGDVRMRVGGELKINDQPLSGEVWVVTDSENNYRRSDHVVVFGVLSRGFGTLPAAIYRAEIKEISREEFSDIGLDLRDNFAEKIKKSINEPEASLASGFLLGQNNQLPEKLDKELQILGLTHIVVASGYNLTVLVRFTRRLFLRISRFTALATGGFLIAGFVQISGLSPSMTRASLIAGLSLLAWYFGRKIHPVVLLLFTAGITVGLNPQYAQGDLGWLLSFSSFAGVVLLAPMVQQYFWGDKKPNFVAQVLVETLSAQIVSLPVIIFAFNHYSALSVIANMIVLPIIPIAMLLTFATGLSSYIWLFLGNVFGLLTELVLRFITGIVEWLAQLPIAVYEFSITINQIVLWYSMLVILFVHLQRRTHYSFRGYNIIE